jgi:hypothetical protein
MSNSVSYTPLKGPLTSVLIGKSVTFSLSFEHGGENGEGESGRDCIGRG